MNMPHHSAAFGSDRCFVHSVFGEFAFRCSLEFEVEFDMESPKRFEDCYKTFRADAYILKSVLLGATKT